MLGWRRKQKERLALRTQALFVALLLSLAPLRSVAQDFDVGFAAFYSGDYVTALREWEPLAEQGNARSQLFLGIMYGNAWGVAQDMAVAVRWYRLAAEQGNVDAQTNLALLYYRGHGVLEDFDAAARWYRAAAEQGDASAQNDLGFMYFKGHGVPQGYVKAHMWYNIAATNGDNIARARRESIVLVMTSTDISEAQRRARVCMASNYQDCD
jgi:uncharacterized protein